MILRHLIGTALLASFALNTAAAQDTTDRQSHDRSADLVIRGRVLHEESEPLPQPPGKILLASLWTYRVRVLRVLHGHEQRATITAKHEADPALREDIDLIFYLTRTPAGTYKVERVARAR